MACKSAEAPKYDIEIDKENYEEGVYAILAELRPQWKKETIQFRVIAQGIVNLMVVCHVTEDCKDAVVVRVFGSLIAAVVNRDQEIKVNQLFSDMGLGATLLAVFKNGICSGFLKGKSFTFMDMDNIKDFGTARKIAKAIAAIHCNNTASQAKELGIGKGSDFIALAAAALEGWPIPFQDKELEKWFYERVPKKDILKEEFAIAQGVIAEIDKETHVLCHGDLNPTNFMTEDDTGDIRLVDFECAGFNTPFSDLSTFFLISAAGPMCTDLESAQHSPEYHRIFLRAYLEEIRRQDGVKGDVSDREVERYYAIVDRLTIAMQFYGMILCPSYLASNPNLTVEGMNFKQIITPFLLRWDYYVRYKDRMLSKID
ncbi:ethanolamine kinase 1-like [Lineus longissimus]|uniref:ethanolamine kinase 1-like n=1 Tax=Lineus longissimus TaxID=88925 RepID=UPI002B4CB6F7